MHIAKLDLHDEKSELFGIHVPQMCLMANLAVSDGSPSQKVCKYFNFRQKIATKKQIFQFLDKNFFEQL